MVGCYKHATPTELGENLEEAKANLLDALTEVMEYHREEARKNPSPGAVREELQLAAS